MLRSTKEIAKHATRLEALSNKEVDLDGKLVNRLESSGQDVDVACE